MVASGRAGFPCLHSGRVSPSPAAPACSRGGGAGCLFFFFWIEEFPAGLEARFPLCACVCTGVCQPLESE